MKRVLIIVSVILWLIPVCFLASLLTLKPKTYNYEKTNSPVFNSNRLWQLINDWQTKQGWQPYIESPKLCEIAVKRLEETKTNWSHEGFKKYWYTFSYVNFAENLARDWTTEEATFNSWLTSPTHKKNLTDYNPYACLKCEGSRCVMLFANFYSGQVQGTNKIQPTNIPQTNNQVVNKTQVIEQQNYPPLPTIIRYPSPTLYPTWVLPTSVTIIYPTSPPVKILCTENSKYFYCYMNPSSDRCANGWGDAYSCPSGLSIRDYGGGKCYCE